MSGPESRRGDPGFLASLVQPGVVRDWLLRPASAITATAESPDAAALWYREWIEDNPRPEWFWGLASPGSAVESMRRMLLERGDRVDTFHVGPESALVSVFVSFIPCPTLCGRYACPQGREDGGAAWAA